MTDPKIDAVLAEFETRMVNERNTPVRELATGEIDERMRPVGPKTGQLLTLLVESLSSPNILELGTSYGYSTIWLAEGARRSGGRVITMEMYDYKSTFAREMVVKAGLGDYVDFRVGDAVAMTKALDGGIDFILVDLWKDLYFSCLEAFYPKLNPGAVIVADNMNPEKDVIRHYGAAVRAKPGMTSIALPIGHALEVSRYEPDGSPYDETQLRSRA